MIMIALVTMSFVSSCKDDDKGSNDLVGTKWTCFYEYGDKQTIIFDSKNTWISIYTASKENGAWSEESSGTYTYKNPDIIFEYNDDGDIERWTGKVIGNTIISDGNIFTKE